MQKPRTTKRDSVIYSQLQRLHEIDVHSRLPNTSYRQYCMANVEGKACHDWATHRMQSMKPIDRHIFFP